MRSTRLNYLELYLLVLGIIFALDLVVFNITLPLFPEDVPLVMMLVVAGSIVAFILEMLVAYTWNFFKNVHVLLARKKSLNIGHVQKTSGVLAPTITSMESSQRDWTVLALVFVLVPILEELIFRGALFYILTGMPLIIVLIVSSFAFSLSHVTFGFRTLIQKFITGIILGVAFIFGNFFILVPIAIHLLENIFILAYLQFRMMSTS